jgi:hypothetical protein
LDGVKTAKTPPIVITVSPIRTPGRFQASLASTDDLLVRSSRQPFLDAARVLVGHGYDPLMILEMKHAGSDTVALRALLGKAAKLTVEEGPNGPRFVAFRTGPKTRVAAPSIAPSAGATTTPPNSNLLTDALAKRETDGVE